MTDNSAVFREMEIELLGLRPGMILTKAVCAGDRVLAAQGTELSNELIARFRENSIKSAFVSVQGVKSNRTAGKESSLTTRTFFPGEFVCFQGEPSKHIFMMDGGELEVIVNDNAGLTPEKISGSGKIVATLSGDKVTFGEIGALLGIPRSASIRAKKESRIMMIPNTGEALDESARKKPEMGLNIAISLTKRIKETNAKITKADKFLKELSDKVSFISRAYLTVTARISDKCANNPQIAWATEQ